MSRTTSKKVASRKSLEIVLQKLIFPDKFDNSSEQYPTDPHVASMLLFSAFMKGDIQGKRVNDLGCGNGILAYGASVLGAKSVNAIDSDPNMTDLCIRNCSGLKVSTETGDVASFHKTADTTVMNPPFGSVVPHSDRIFIEKGCALSRKVYSIHNAKSYDFVRSQYELRGSILEETRLVLSVPRIYSHHSRERMDIEAVMFEVECIQPGKKHN